MKIIIPGGSGQIGSTLAKAFVRDGHEVVILSRSSAKSTTGRTVLWDAESLGDWAREIDGSDVVINLAGRSVNCRYNSSNRCEILESRVKSTKVIGKAIEQSKSPPRVWLQSSTATIYSHRFDAGNDEDSGIIGGNEPNLPDSWKFSYEVAHSWEAALNEAQTPQTRKVALRAAMTMSPNPGGVFDVMLGLVNKGLGGRMGDGRQFVSWIHEVDFIRVVNRLIVDEAFSGPVNLSAPNPLPNTEFMRELRKAAGVRFGLPATRWMLEVGAIFMRTETELILKSRRVTPGKLLARGFEFQFPTWPEAAKDLCAGSKSWSGSRIFGAVEASAS